MIMFRSSSRILSRSATRDLRAVYSRRLFSSKIFTTAAQGKTPTQYVGVALFCIGVATAAAQTNTLQRTWLDAGRPRVPIGGDIIQVGPPVKEPGTGILFPHLCNGFDFTGCGVRIKWGFIKVYAVGTYLDRIAMSAVKQSDDRETLEKALLNPDYPRTIRIVMARGLSIEKFTSGIVESLEPRMGGEDLDKLDEFKKLMPKVDLVKGAEMLMTIRGDSLLFKNPLGSIGEIKSKVFTKAMCDVYYGADPVSPSHKEDVLKGIKKL